MNCWNPYTKGISSEPIAGRPTTITPVSKGEVSLKYKT